MSINRELARALNWQRRQAMGAAGTVSPHALRYNLTLLRHVDAESIDLWNLVKEAEFLSRDLRKHAKSIEEYFLLHGSPSTQATIAIRRRAMEKLRLGEELTEEEAAVIEGKKLSRRSKKDKMKDKESQAESHSRK